MYMNELYFHSCTKNFHKKDINGMDLRILMYSLYILINLMKYNFFLRSVIYKYMYHSLFFSRYNVKITIIDLKKVLLIYHVK